MINKETMKIVHDLQDCNAAIGTNHVAEALGISPKGFKRYLEGLECLPDWAIEVTDEGERRTFRILTERFAAFISASDFLNPEEDVADVAEKEIVGFMGVNG